MLFTKLTEYFEQLEKTSSRLALIDILTELFKSASKEELQEIIYLSQGRVAPFYAPIEIGMADKMVAQAIANSYGMSKEDVLKLYEKKGDMGETAMELSEHPQHSLFAKKDDSAKRGKLSVSDVFKALLEIAHTSGEGSVEKKITQLQELLMHFDGVTVKHLTRIPLSNSRLGVGDPTILDGLAIAFLGDKSQRKLLEKAYNETSDLGLIGETLATTGLEAVKKLGVKVGQPIRSELCERLPNPTKAFEKMDPNGEGLHVTPKYDGFRVQIHKNGDEVRMFSRNLEEMTHMFPELIEGTLKQIKVKTAILDSEAIAYQPESEEFLPFQETTKRRRKHNIDEVAKTLPLKAFVFDMLYYDGKSLMDLPLRERVEMIKNGIDGDEILIPAPGKVLKQPEELQLMLDDSITKGLEGVVVKRIDSLYEAGGRNFNWIKLKRHSSSELQDTIDCVIIGYIYGKGKRTAFGAGALLVAVYDKEKDEFVSVTRIGTGLSDEEWQSIKTKAHGLESDHKPARVNSKIEPSVWVKPELVIEVLADEITRSPLHTAGANPEAEDPKEAAGYALRFPRLVTFRDKDKRPEDATSVEELIAMFGQQGKK